MPNQPSCHRVLVGIWAGGRPLRRARLAAQVVQAPSPPLRFAADADFEEKETLVWCILNPADWFKEAHLGWRWRPSELAKF